MCDNPIEMDGNVFACRICNGCISARRNGWVARAMAEASCWKFSTSITLTYRDGEPGAHFFAYHNVRAFLKRLRSAIDHAYPGQQVRFICAGEQGERLKRCHWHIVIFSDCDLAEIGTFTHPARVLRPDELYTTGKRAIRLDWSLWPHGFVTLQRADISAMHYVLSYCLKDQFSLENSKGTARETRAELFATGLFRMSKRPAIGERWLSELLADLEAKRAVLPSTRLMVPGMAHYWYPTGTLRRMLLEGLRAINDLRIAEGLGEAPQWPGLLASCKDNPKDMEILDEQTGQKIQEEQDEFDRRTKVLTRYGKDWELDYVGEKERARSYAELQRKREGCICLCASCVTTTYGKPTSAYHAGNWFFVAGEGYAELGGSEVVRHLWPEGAACETCGSTTGLWAVEARETPHPCARAISDVQAPPRAY